jgi:RHS repeat-associated protein
MAPVMFNGPPVLQFGFIQEPTCFHGIQQGTRAACECSCKAVEFLGIAQDTGGGNVDLHTGQFRLHIVDLRIRSRGFDWSFERAYRSASFFNGPLGYNWEFNYNRRLFVQPDGNVLRMDGFGRADRYTLVRNEFESPRGFYTHLLKNADGSFTERDRTRTQVLYSAPEADGLARMVELRDRNGNRMRFLYNSDGQLTQVLDTLGRAVDYHYDGSGRLVEVIDFIGRAIHIDYNLDGDLTAVTSPSVTGTPNGNDFPDGKTTRYRYRSGSADARFDHQLLELTRPNEVASDGPPCLLVEYDTDPDSPNAGRVTRQTMGGLNATGVPAGGVLSYSYLPLERTEPDEFKASVSQTVVMDRNGNQTEYQFNQVGDTLRIREFANRGIHTDAPQFFESLFEYNRDGELTLVIKPEGNSVQYRYDDNNLDRLQQGNLLAETHVPDPRRGADQQSIRVSYTYEPLFNQRRTITDARGNDPTYVPPNGGTQAADRYTTESIFDYQEGADLGRLAERLAMTVEEVSDLLGRAGISIGLGDVNGDGRTDGLAGNVVKLSRPAVTLLPDSLTAEIEGGTRQAIEETFTFNAAGQLLSRRDPEGNFTVYDYHAENDPDGDGQDLTPGVGAGPFGYLKEMTRDALSEASRNSNTDPPPARITHRYFYDRVGNLIRDIDGRGVASDYLVNQLNQVVQVTRAADVSQALENPREPRWSACSNEDLIECTTGMVPFQYWTRFSYDANGNLVELEIENRDSNNDRLVGRTVSEVYKYDILNNLVELEQHISKTPSVTAVTRFRYDQNENRVLVISPVATLAPGDPSFQPSNVVSSVFDERDLLFTSTRGGLTNQFRSVQAHSSIPELSNTSDDPAISTIAYGYDGNRNRIEAFTAGPDAQGLQPTRTTFLFDGFDRCVSVIDAAGNQSFTRYDPANNTVRVTRYGPVGGPTPQNNSAANFEQPLRLAGFTQPQLSELEEKYDEVGRLFERNDRLFAYDGVTYQRTPELRDGSLGQSNDGWVTTRYEYDRKGRPTVTTTEHLSKYRRYYDGVDRVIRAVDAEGNETLYEYDGGHNVVRVRAIEVSQQDDVREERVPNLRETFDFFYVYDALGRRIRATDALGQTIRYRYDSRNNLLFTSDAQHSTSSEDLIADPIGVVPASIRINRLGNTRERFYDGLGRRIADVRHLRTDGQGKNPVDTHNSANPDGLIVVDYEWDPSGRLVATADDGSEPGRQNTSIGLIERVNPGGNVTRHEYDALSRRARSVFSDGSVAEYTYDVDDNLVRVVDGNGSIVTSTFDVIDRLVRRDVERATSAAPHPAGGFKDPHVGWEVIGTTSQEFAYDGLSRLTRWSDDNGSVDADDGALVSAVYDSLGHLLEEVQNSLAVSSRWDGHRRRVGVVYPDGREITIGFDGLDRIRSLGDREGGGIVEYSYIGPDRVLERTYANGVRRTSLDKERVKDIGYDAIGRVVLQSDVRPGSESTLPTFAYAYDRMNNKVSEIKLHDHDSREEYSYDSVYRLVGFRRDGILEDGWRLDGVGNWARRGDVANSVNNMNEYTEFMGEIQQHDDDGNLVEDARNRYQYDFANRLCRVVRKADNAEIATYRYDARNRRIGRIVKHLADLDDETTYYYDELQETERVGRLGRQQYVYGLRIDEVLTLDNAFGAGNALERRFFYHADGKRCISALTNGHGVIVERYVYDAYGRPTVRGADGATRIKSAVGNSFLFAGRGYDPETGCYYCHRRHLDPLQGRFKQRDPLDMMDGGNWYEYGLGNPVNNQDPLGLACDVTGHEECELWADWACYGEHCWTTGHHTENCHTVVTGVVCHGDEDPGVPGPGGGTCGIGLGEAPALLGLLGWVRCAWYLRKYAGLIATCNARLQAHCPAGRCSDEDYDYECMQYLDSIGATDPQSGMLMCVQRTNPDAFRNLAETCFKASLKHVLGSA